MDGESTKSQADAAFLRPPSQWQQPFYSASNHAVETDPASAEGKARQPPRKWSKEEDRKLASLLIGHGANVEWNLIANKMDGRSAKQCRERYKIQTSSGKGPWTEAEDKQIIRMQAMLGNKWSKIAETLPGRSDGDVKNRFNTNISKRGRSGSDDRASEVAKKQKTSTAENLTSPTGSNLSDHEVTLCHQLLNLQGTLKKSNGGAKDVTNEQPDEEEYYEDYLYEHIAMMRKINSSGQGRGTANAADIDYYAAACQESKAKEAKKKKKKKKPPVVKEAGVVEKSKASTPTVKHVKAEGAKKAKDATKSSAPPAQADSQTASVKSDAEAYDGDRSKWPLVGIEEPGCHDCLVGRGGGTNHHPGNIKFRHMIEVKKSEYKASSRHDKPLVSMSIVQAWRSLEPPGRFLKQDVTTKLWNDIGDEMARQKCSQALRELRKEIKLKLPDEYSMEDPNE